MNATVAPASSSPARSRLALPAPRTLLAAASWPMAAYASFVFLSSLPYKLSGAPTTEHIFSTIGAWIGTGLGPGIGDAFARFGAYAVGSAELLVSLLLLAPAALWIVGRARGRRTGPSRARLHALGGAGAAALMAGAVFFHLESPLGTVVVHDGTGDGGALFGAALTVLAMGVALVAINARHALRG